MNSIDPHIQKVIATVSQERLRAYLRDIEGCRHGWKNYQSLEEKAVFIGDTLRSCSLDVESQEFQFHGKPYRNIVATHHGSNEEAGMVLLGAHYDAAVGSPGADDNASGVAVMLETANILSKYKFENTVQFAAFTLEEPQPHTIHFLIGSNHFAEEARKLKRKYRAVLILESVGYTDNAEGSQIAPPFIKVQVPRTGNFLGVVADRKSRDIMNFFSDIAGRYVPELSVVTYKVPFSGRIVPETRFSDHASFWNQGYPALMLTDTAMFRNPHYHSHRDRYETLDFNFMTDVAKAVVSATAFLLGMHGSPV
jgi:aminopeptidase YwaD